MFVVLNIIERRKICLGVKLLTQNSALPRVVSLLKGLNYEEVKRKLHEQSQSKLQDGALSQLMQATSVANGLERGSCQYMRNCFLHTSANAFGASQRDIDLDLFYSSISWIFSAVR
jgi:hypothetical protein